MDSKLKLIIALLLTTPCYLRLTTIPTRLSPKDLTNLKETELPDGCFTDFTCMESEYFRFKPNSDHWGSQDSAKERYKMDQFSKAQKSKIQTPKNNFFINKNSEANNQTPNNVNNQSQTDEFEMRKPNNNNPNPDPNSLDKCRLWNVYITLGDYFENIETKTPAGSDNLYRVAFQINSLACLEHVSLQIFTVDPNTDILSSYAQEESLYEEEVRLNGQMATQFYVRNYKFSGSFKSVNYKIDKLFAFTDLTRDELPDSGFFGYAFKLDESNLKGPYIFRSEVMAYESGLTESLEIVSFGDHDVMKQGSTTLSALNKETDVDLYLLLGDYAYDMHEDNGEKGDEYFAEMEAIFTRQPVVFIPGNHEYFDHFAFFYARLTFPGDSFMTDSFKFDPSDTSKTYLFTSETVVRSIDRDLTTTSSGSLFHFLIRDIFVITANLDIIFSKDKLLIHIIERISKVLESISQIARYRIFASHRPFNCSLLKLVAQDCFVNSFHGQPLQALMDKYHFNLFLAGHLHQYERLVPLIDWKLAYPNVVLKSVFAHSGLALARHNPSKFLPTLQSTMIISGSAGCAHLFEPVPKEEIEYLVYQKQVTPGFSVLSFLPHKTNHIKHVLIRFLSSESPELATATQAESFRNKEPLDQILVTSLTLASDKNVVIVLVVLILVFIFASFAAGIFIKKKYVKMKSVSEEGSATNYGQVVITEKDQDSLMDEESTNSMMSGKTKQRKE